MKKVVMMVLVIGMMVLTGCGASTDSADPTQSTHSPEVMPQEDALDGVWETDEEEPDRLIIEGDTAVYETDVFGVRDSSTCTIDKEAKTIMLSELEADTMDYSFAQGRLILKEKYNDDNFDFTLVFHRVE